MNLTNDLSQTDLLWALGSVCALHRLPFSAEMVAREFPPPWNSTTLIAAARAVALRIKQVPLDPAQVDRMVFPLLVGLAPVAQGDTQATTGTLGIVTAAAEGKVVLFRAGSAVPQTLTVGEFAQAVNGQAWLVSPHPEAVVDHDAPKTARRFGFGWFVPELLRHRKVWRDVLLASLALQLITLATPLFTQAIIDKVITHHSRSTLVAVGVAMLIFTVFTSLLTWVRQYPVLRQP